MTATVDNEITLHIGEFYFGGGRTRIRTLLGSCVSITMWHPVLRIGGMCHYLLPRSSSRAVQSEQGRTADGAISLFLHELQRSRTAPREYVVQLLGGGNMFQGTPLDPSELLVTAGTAARLNSIAEQNVRAGRQLLDRHGFQIAAEEVGGHGSRHLTCDLWSGDVRIRRGSPLTVNLPALS